MGCGFDSRQARQNKENDMMWLKTFDGYNGNKEDLVEFLLSSVNCVKYDIETGYIKEIRSNNLVIRLVWNAVERIPLVNFQAKSLKELEMKLALAGFIYDDSKCDADNGKWNLNDSRKRD